MIASYFLSSNEQLSKCVLLSSKYILLLVYSINFFELLIKAIKIIMSSIYIESNLSCSGSNLCHIGQAIIGDV